MTILIKVLQLILCLSILVIVHEFGHYIAAKIFKTRVTKFYIFFHIPFLICYINHLSSEVFINACQAHKWQVAMAFFCEKS